MIRIILFVISFALFPIQVVTAKEPVELHANENIGCHIDSPDQDVNGDESKSISIETQYGMVQYTKIEPRILVNGKTISWNERGAIDRLNCRGYFKLSTEVAILFEGANGGNTGIHGQTFFLILKPNKNPKIVDARIDSLDNPIKSVWQKDDVILVDFDVTDYDEFKPPLRLVADLVTISKSTPAIYAKSGPRLSDSDCDTIYERAASDCKAIFKENGLSCQVYANAGNGMGGSLADMGFVRWIAHWPGFNASKFDDICGAWCKGQDTTIEKFKSAVCNIR